MLVTLAEVVGKKRLKRVGAFLEPVAEVITPELALLGLFVAIGSAWIGTRLELQSLGLFIPVTLSLVWWLLVREQAEVYLKILFGVIVFTAGVVLDLLAS